MSQTNTDIQLRRSRNTPSALGKQILSFGEPFFIDNIESLTTEGTISDTGSCDAYLVLGRKPREGETSITLEQSPVIKAMSLNKSKNLVFCNDERTGIYDESNNPISIDMINAETIDTETDISQFSENEKFYILCQSSSNKVYKFDYGDRGIFMSRTGTMNGAAWNDYAEFRKVKDSAVSGQVVCDNGDGTVSVSTKRLQCCPHVVSDTFGHVIGNDKDSIPIAVSGKALVKVDTTDIELGDCVCSGVNGIASKMTRQEIINYPDRILGVVCEIPNYTNIDNVEVNGRIWINVK